MVDRLIGEDINVETILADNLPNIKADRSQLEQIFINLIVNAQDALRSESNNFKKRITIETGLAYIDSIYVSKHPGSKKGRQIFFAVSDNGCGMDKIIKQKIFEPFFTTKDKGKGTGLGLSTVYGIVKQNSGSVYVYSEPGEGTTFKIYWPVTNEKNLIIEKEVNNQKLHGKESILIVEDEKEVCRFAAELLTNFGYNIYTAYNGRIAMDFVKNKKPRLDLIITDMIMPELGGMEFVQKALQLYPDIKVIYVSGYADNHIVHNGLLENNINFVHKPYSIKALASAVRKVLDE